VIEIIGVSAVVSVNAGTLTRMESPGVIVTAKSPGLKAVPLPFRRLRLSMALSGDLGDEDCFLQEVITMPVRRQRDKRRHIGFIVV
jgi:hypothetical protein